MFRYLKDDQHYIDLYDIYTIEKCLDRYRNIRDGFEEKRNAEEYKKLGKKEFDKEVSKIASYTVNFIKAERYRYKKETIQKWMDRDRKEQEKFDSATAPHGVLCKECFSETKIIFKDTFSDLIPTDLLSANKKGFSVPVGNWFRNELKVDLLQKLEREKIEEQGIFNYRYIEIILDEHFTMKKNRSSELWTLYIFQKWYMNYFL